MKTLRVLLLCLALALLGGCGGGKGQPLRSPEGAVFSFDAEKQELMGLELNGSLADAEARLSPEQPWLRESLFTADPPGTLQGARDSMLRYESGALCAGDRPLAVTLYACGSEETLDGVFVYDLFSDPEEAERQLALYGEELAPLSAVPAYTDSVSTAGMRDFFPFYAVGGSGREEVRLYFVRSGSPVAAELPAHPSAGDFSRAFADSGADCVLLLSRGNFGEGTAYEGWFGMALLSPEALEPLLLLWRSGGNSLIG